MLITSRPFFEKEKKSRPFMYIFSMTKMTFMLCLNLTEILLENVWRALFLFYNVTAKLFTVKET